MRLSNKINQLVNTGGVPRYSEITNVYMHKNGITTGVTRYGNVPVQHPTKEGSAAVWVERVS